MALNPNRWNIYFTGVKQICKYGLVAGILQVTEMNFLEKDQQTQIDKFLNMLMIHEVEIVLPKTTLTSSVILNISYLKTKYIVPLKTHNTYTRRRYTSKA